MFVNQVGEIVSYWTTFLLRAKRDLRNMILLLYIYICHFFNLHCVLRGALSSELRV